MIKYASILMAILLVFGQFKCNKSLPSAPTSLPPITQNGSNTFGFLVNGQVWDPFWPCSEFVPGLEQFFYQILPLDSSAKLPILFSLKASNITGSESFFSMRQNYTLSDHIFGPGNVIDSILIEYDDGASGKSYFNSNPYYPGAPLPRYFQITKLDTIYKIVSGIFNFTMYNQAVPGGPLDSVIISEGRFDLMMGVFSTCSK